MNKQQVKYAEERLKQIKKEKMDEWQDKYPYPPDFKTDQMWASIKSGKAILQNTKPSTYADFYDCWEYPEQKLVEKAQEKWQKGWDAFYNKLGLIISESVDQLYLGDTQEALTAIQKLREVKID